MVVGVIAGTSFFELSAFPDAKKKSVKTDYGTVDVFVDKQVAFIPRHGVKKDIPPHLINHRGHLAALKKLGAKQAVFVCSVGALRLDYHLPAIIVPHDYFCLWNAPTFFEDEIKHVTPGFDEGLRKTILGCGEKLGVPLIARGVYVQTRGPRLETKAEISFLSSVGEVVGMTGASESTLAAELNIPHALLCSIDNYAHGLVEASLTEQEIRGNARQSGELMLDLVKEVVGELA